MELNLNNYIVVKPNILNSHQSLISKYFYTFAHK